MKSLIVIALSLTSAVSFATTATTKTAVTTEKKVETCANLKGAELTACEAKNTKTPVVADKKAATETKVEAKTDAKAAKATKTATATATTTAPAAKK
jgi:hypothetical protein